MNKAQIAIKIIIALGVLLIVLSILYMLKGGN
jgi:hypothetical protein